MNRIIIVVIHHFVYLLDIADGLVGVGLITQSEDMPGMLQLDKGHNDMSKFLNRILGMKVERQNALFKYFADTLNAIINQAKRSGKYDQVRLITHYFIYWIYTLGFLNDIQINNLIKLHIIGYIGCRFNRRRHGRTCKNSYICKKTRHRKGQN